MHTRTRAHASARTAHTHAHAHTDTHTRTHTTSYFTKITPSLFFGVAFAAVSFLRCGVALQDGKLSNCESVVLKGAYVSETKAQKFLRSATESPLLLPAH